ncbi:hypothetical protein LXL04_006256 [Taraxacum kok-saghyz]
MAERMDKETIEDVYVVLGPDARVKGKMTLYPSKMRITYVRDNKETRLLQLKLKQIKSVTWKPDQTLELKMIWGLVHRIAGIGAKGQELLSNYLNARVPILNPAARLSMTEIVFTCPSGQGAGDQPSPAQKLVDALVRAGVPKMVDVHKK